jgi:hypothetical protein
LFQFNLQALSDQPATGQFGERTSAALADD